MMTKKYIAIMILALSLNSIFSGISHAFTDMSMTALDKAMKEMKQGSSKAGSTIRSMLEKFSGADLKRYTSEETIAEVKKLIQSGKVQAYIMDKGHYTYTEGNNILHVDGTNVRMRSQPNAKARIIATFNTKTTDYLAYLGEWKNLKGERWVLVKENLSRKASGRLGWIYGKYVRLVPNTWLQKFISDAKSSVDNREKTNTSSADNKTFSLPRDFMLMCIFVVVVYFFALVKLFEVAKNMFQLVIYSIIVIGLSIAAYMLIKLFILKVVIPILAVIFLLLGLGGGCSHTECPFYSQYRSKHCDDCPYS